MSDVDRLVAFDRDVVQLVIDKVEDLHGRLKQQQIHNEQINGGRVLQMLKGIRENESLRPRFSLILNQAVVLLVSYFGSAVEDIFCRAVNGTLQAGDESKPIDTESKLMKADMKLTIAELMEVVAHPEGGVAELLIEKKDLSFQDMQAMQRAFRDYVGVDIEKDKTVNNIIVAQACRHVIVHAGGESTPRLLRQVSGATPRDLKKDLLAHGAIQFSESEVQLVAASMKKYVSMLVETIEGL